MFTSNRLLWWAILRDLRRFFEHSPVAALQIHLQQFSTSRALRLCHPENPCRNRRCPHCSTPIATRARGDLRAFGRTHPHALFVVLSVKSAPTVEDAWDSLARARAEFLRSSWLSNRSVAVYRQTEITFGAEPHPHDNLLVWVDSEEDLAPLADAFRARWVDAAARAGTFAITPDVRPVRSMVDATRYVSKSLFTMGSSPGDVPGTSLERWAYLGDQDAGDRWLELENYFSTRRVVATRAGLLRTPRKPHKPRSGAVGGRPSLNLFDEYISLPPRASMRRHATMLGCSTATVANLKTESEGYLAWLATNTYTDLHGCRRVSL
jgi:hypothetical protein